MSSTALVGRAASARPAVGLMHVHGRHESCQPWPGSGQWHEASGDARPAVGT